ncbi:MAG: type 4a pilus biogenesis protein PilO [Patescibacteria group bacterium]
MAEKRFKWKYIKPPVITPTKTKVYTMVGLSLLALIIFGAFAIRPALATVVELKKKVIEQKEASLKLEQKIKDLSRAQILLSKHENDIQLLEKALPHKKNSAQILETIYALAKRNNLRPNRLSFAKENQIKIKLPNDVITIHSVPILLQVEGVFPDFNSFLQDLENSSRLIDIDEIRINKTRYGTELYRINLRSYFAYD